MDKQPRRATLLGASVTAAAVLFSGCLDNPSAGPSTGGADLKTVMDRLGHIQIQTTQKYLHALPDADDRALAAFERTRGRDAGA